MSGTSFRDPAPAVGHAPASGGAHVHRRISWGAIFGGVILVVVVQLLLSMLGAGIGLGTVNTNAGSTPALGFRPPALPLRVVGCVVPRALGSRAVPTYRPPTVPVRGGAADRRNRCESSLSLP